MDMHKDILTLLHLLNDLTSMVDISYVIEVEVLRVGIVMVCWEEHNKPPMVMDQRLEI